MTLFARAQRAVQWGIGGLDWLSPVVSLLFRVWVANIFWKAGMTKLANWESTLYLFEYEYAVPLIPTELAAFLGTGVEITMPILLAIGLGTRFSALVLFVFNVIAVVSYPTLNEIGIKDHQYWGLMLLVPLFYGPGALSIDHFVRGRLWKNGVGRNAELDRRPAIV